MNMRSGTFLKSDQFFALRVGPHEVQEAYDFLTRNGAEHVLFGVKGVEAKQGSCLREWAWGEVMVVPRGAGGDLSLVVQWGAAAFTEAFTRFGNGTSE